MRVRTGVPGLARSIILINFEAALRFVIAKCRPRLRYSCLEHLAAMRPCPGLPYEHHAHGFSRICKGYIDAGLGLETADCTRRMGLDWEEAGVGGQRQGRSGRRSGSVRNLGATQTHSTTQGYRNRSVQQLPFRVPSHGPNPHTLASVLPLTCHCRTNTIMGALWRQVEAEAR